MKRIFRAMFLIFSDRTLTFRALLILYIIDVEKAWSIRNLLHSLSYADLISYHNGDSALEWKSQNRR